MAKLFRAVIMGPPGSGKGTISERIAQRFGLTHLSSGDFVRENIAANTDAGVLAKTYIERGSAGAGPCDDTAPTSQAGGDDPPQLADGWVSRTLAQAKALNSTCDLDLVISLNIPYETLKDRLSDRWIHPASGRVYNMGFNPPRVQGRDDISGEPLIHHDDDKPEALVARLRQYKDLAKPIINLYKSKGILHTFSGTDTDRIWPYINSLLSTKIPSTSQTDTQRIPMP